jgi:hypothetical protein
MFKYERIVKENQFEKYDVKDFEKDLKFFTKLSLKDLRKRQDLNADGLEKAYKLNKYDTIKKLQVIDRILFASVDIVEFGDTPISEWSKVLYQEFK